MTALAWLRPSRLAPGALVLLTALRAAAQDPGASGSMRFVWNRSPDASACAEASAIEADVVKRLGWNPFSPSARSSLECEVTRNDGVWTAGIEERDENGVRAGYREVTSLAPSCESLGSAVALAISLIVRNRVASAPPPEPPASPPAVVPVAAPPREPPPEPDDERATVAWHAGATAAARVLPKLAVGASMVARFSPAPSVSVAGRLTVLPAVRVNDASGRYGFSGAWGAVGPCYDVEFGADVGLSTCVSPTLGAIQVTVYEPTPVRPGGHVFAGIIAGPELHWSVAAPFALTLGLDAFVPVKRSSFLLDDAGATRAVFVQPAVGALLTLGAGFGR